MTGSMIVGSDVTSSFPVIPTDKLYVSHSENAIAGGFGAKKEVEKGVLGTIKGAMKLGAKTGALFGGLGSFGRSLQEEEPTVTGTLAQTGIGTGIGAIGGAIMGGALATPFALGKAVQPNAAMKRLETEYSRILNLTQKQLQTEDKFAKNSAKFIAEELVPLEVKGGRLDTSVAREMLGTKYSSESKAFQNILDDSSEYINFSQFARNAAKQIKEKGTAQYSAINHLRKELSAYASQFGQGVKNEAGDLLIPVGQFNRIKQDLWSKTKWTTESEKLFAQLNYRVGHTAKEMIESAIEDANVKVFNSRLGDFAAALNILEKRHGAVAPGGRMGQYFASLIGAVAGSKGGPIGTVTGAMTGRKLAELLQNPKVTTYFSRKLVDTLVKEGKQDVVDEAMKIITQRTIMRSSRLKLPIPSFIAGHPYKGSMSSFIPESARTKPFIHKLPIKQP